VIISSAQVSAVTGSPWNIRAAQEDLLDAFDKQDKERYFSSAQQPQMAQQGQPQQQGAVEPQGPGGVTAPQATNADTSPSHQASLVAGDVHAARRSQYGGA
jgi:hypothetical protein